MTAKPSRGECGRRMQSIGGVEQVAVRPILLSDVLHRRRNAFDVILLIAALMVIFGHSFYLFPNWRLR